jgi:hypothetical protein
MARDRKNPGAVTLTEVHVAHDKLRRWVWLLVAVFVAGAVAGMAGWWNDDGWLRLAGFSVVFMAMGLGGGFMQMLSDGKPRVAFTAHGLAVAAWGVTVAWRDIDQVSVRGRWVVVGLRDPEFYLASAGGHRAFFMRLFGKFGRGPFAIETSVYDVTAPELAAAIRKRAF